MRGLKYNNMPPYLAVYMSHLSRGAWIEITKKVSAPLVAVGRTSHGVRGLK
ncbi:protein of unknown function [Ruminococcaceae bacterium BL-4]|nr:protein of unknown function [Ruminococcaceae bacterium BL-4]